jgi:Methyltransferase domain
LNVIGILEEDLRWQMTLGERAALEGLLGQLKPALALEVGTAQGGSLKRLAAHSREVHTFDMQLPPEAEQYPDHVHFHTGNSHEVLRPWLEELREQGRHVDFALVDGDHTADGVRADIEDILDSGALRGVLLVHDSTNPTVRRGLNSVEFSAYPSVRYVDRDFVAGHLGRRGEYRGQLWGGFGLVVADLPKTGALAIFASRRVEQDAFYSPHALIRPTAEVVGSPGRLVGLMRRTMRTLAYRTIWRRPA